jgi:hypothetical protein
VGHAYCPTEGHPDVIRVVKQKDCEQRHSEKDIEFVIRTIEIECGLRMIDPLMHYG